MKNIFKNILLLLTTLTCGIIVTELFVKLFFPQNLIYYNNDIWRPDSLFGWRHYENVNTTVNTGVEGLVHFITDDNGYRINKNTSDAIDNKDHHINVLVLGDSFLEALQVDNEETIPQLLKQDMSLKYNLDVNFYNSAVGGWNPNHYYLETKKVLQHKIVDLGIVFLYVANDIVEFEKISYKPRQIARVHRFHLPEKINWREFINSVLYPINDFFEVRSHLYLLIKNRSQSLLSTIGLTASRFPKIFLLNEQFSSRWEITTGICKQIYNEFKNYEIPVIFVLLPSVYQCDENIFYKDIGNYGISLDSVDLKQPNRLLAHHFTVESLQLYDPLLYMQNQLNNGYIMYGKIDGHFNEEGHRIVADYVFPIVIEKLKKRL